MGEEKIMEELLGIVGVVILLGFIYLYKREFNENDRLRKELAATNSDLVRMCVELDKHSVRDPKTGKFAKRFQT